MTKTTTEATVSEVPTGVLQEGSTALQETTEHQVRRWVSENLTHGRIARDVDLWNEIQAALPALVNIIDA